jgi:molecular chaperone GrpE
MPSSPENDAGRYERAEGAEVAEQQGRAADAASPPPSGNGESEDLTAELARIEDRYKRALADLDNYRKRSEREIAARVAEAKESVLRDWLDAVDSVERALRMDADGPCADGLRAVLQQMDAVLARQGAQRIGAAGDRFDPERHEAIAVQPSQEVPDRTVLAVERSGYVVGDRVIRPAQVVVARTPEHAR